MARGSRGAESGRVCSDFGSEKSQKNMLNIWILVWRGEGQLEGPED